MVGGACGATEPEPAKFNRFIVWNCEKGLEFVNAGSLQFHDCLLVSGQDCQLKLAVDCVEFISSSFTWSARFGYSSFSLNR